MDKEGFIASYGVPRGTVDKLSRYAELLIEWNARFNLVAESTLPHLWARHMADSAQLFPLIPRGANVLVDLGSGAGFPGMVLALMGVPEVHLVESIGKKANFLRAVAEELAPHVQVHHDRAEKIKGLVADVVTARAVTALPDLLSMAKPFMTKDSVGLFLKGEKAAMELTEARKYWTFACEQKTSQTDPSGTVLVLSEVKVVRPHVRKRHT